MFGPKHPERIKLNNKIKEWNSNRLDLFQVSEPNEYLEFYGVMRFFYQGYDLKYQTKCLRVVSTATTSDVVEALKVKFHPDLRTLNNDKYILYESHNLQDRRMKNSEHPLSVQLSWAFDDIDGKFILKNESRRRRSTDMTNHSILSNYGMSRSTSTLANGYDSQTLRTQSSAVYSSSSNFFSRRFSNSKKSKKKSKADREDLEEAKRLAEEMSGKPPESSFTRTISNPDDVMKRRRQKKLESRLEQFSGIKGDGETGGTLKIYGDSINPDVPYKTLLLSVNDTAVKILAETLDKYGIQSEDHLSYVLVQQNIPPREARTNRSNIEEIILHESDCPLGILVHCPPKQGTAMFSVRKILKSDKFPASPRMPPFAFSKKAENIEQRRNRANGSDFTSVPDEYCDPLIECPRLKKLFVDADGSLYDEDDGLFTLSSLINTQLRDSLPVNGSKVIKIGSQSSLVGDYPNIWLPLDDYNDIRSVHCHLSAKLDPQTNRMEFHVTPTLDSSSRTPRPCVVFINQERIDSTTRISNGDVIQLGDSVLFRFEEFEGDEEETESVACRPADESVSQEVSEESSQSRSNSYFTAELPVMVKFKYQRSAKLVANIMKFSEDYAEKGSKELFTSCAVGPEDKGLDLSFRLSTAYVLYLVMRAGLYDDQQIVQLIELVADHFDKAIQENRTSVEKEIFWLSNSSELLHLLQSDNDLRLYSASAQEVLATAVEHTFSIIQQQFSKDLMILLPALLSEDDLDIDDNTQEDNIPCLDRAIILTEQGSIDYPIQHLLQTLSLAFTLFHNCQVNVALTVQMFSQLFHLLNTWLFNAVLGNPASGEGEAGYSVPICQEWGNRLTRRLNRIRYWSEINGLEMAANCHLQKMYQVAELMKADKSDLAIFGEKCIEMISLNGVQLQHLLANCQDYELPDPWIEVVVNTSIQLNDQDFNESSDTKNPPPSTRTTLDFYEDMELRLPLLLPADGYCCDRGIVTCPRDMQAMLDYIRNNLKYRLNPPLLEEMDIRWKVYLGPCENTPTVSRSNTIDQSSTSPVKPDGPYLPRNWVRHSVPSDSFSTSETLSSPSKERQQPKKPLATVSSQSSSQYSQPARNSLPTSNKKHSASISESVESQTYSISKNHGNEQMELKLRKIDNSLGLSIIAAKPPGKDEVFRIYVKDVIAGGAGAKSGQIFTGDQLVSIDGYLLDDMDQEEAVMFMKKTKAEVTLFIDRGAARRHGVMDAIVQARSSKTNLSIPKQGQRPPNHQAPAIKKPLSSSITPLKGNISLPPPPTMKPPPKPQQNQPLHNSKLPHKATDLRTPEQDYSSLPIRKHQSNQLSNQEVPVYATVKKGQPMKVKFDTDNHLSLKNKSPMFSSQPNLNNTIPKSKLKQDRSPSGSSSSGSISSTDDDDEESITSPSKPTSSNNEKRNSSSFYERIPQQHRAAINGPSKSISDINIPAKKIEATPSDSGISKRPFFSRPVLTHDLDQDLSTGSQDGDVPVNLNKPVKRNQSSSSESESETISSHTESGSSDPSPQPQRRLSSEPIQLPTQIGTEKHKEPVQLSLANEAIASGKPANRRSPINIPDLGGFKKPVLVTNAMTLDDVLKLPVSNQTGNGKAKIPDEIIEKKFELPKMPSEEEIRLRRKAIADSIRQQTEEKEQRIRAADTQSNTPAADHKDSRPNSTMYGRPQFNTTSPPLRPTSLCRPDQDSDPLITQMSFPSPPSPLAPGGIVVPASPIKKSPMIGLKPINNQMITNHVRVEELSFQDKMKLFASKIGDENIIERKKFSSKQQKINSGDYS